MKLDNKIKKSSNMKILNEKFSIDDIDSLINDYVGQIKIPDNIESNIFKKINYNSDKFNKIGKSALGIFFFNLQNTTNSHATNFLIISIVSMLTILTPYQFTNKNYSNDNLVINSNTNQNDNNSVSEIVNNKINKNLYNEINKVNIDNYKNSEIQSFENDKKYSIIYQSELTDKDNEVINNFTIKNESLVISIFPKIYETKLNIQPFNFELKYSSFNNLNYNETNFQNEAVLLNYSLGLWYPISSNLIVGGEFRQEHFTMAKNEQIETKRFNCWEAGVKYYPNIDLSYLQPYLQFNLGANSGGVLSRATLGLNLEIENNFNVFIGTELNSLFYLNNKQIKSTERVGVNFGINLILK